MTSLLTIPSPYPNFLKVRTSGEGSPFESTVGDELPIGQVVGKIASDTTLSLINGPCVTAVTVDIPFMNCTTDYLKPAPWVGTGDNLVLDCNGNMNEDGTTDAEGDGNCIDTVDNDADTLVDCYDPDCNDEADDYNDIPTYCDHWPDFLTGLVTDKNGKVLRPRIRLEGHAVVLGGNPATMLNYLIYSAGSLATMDPPVGYLGDARGVVNFVELDNTTAAVSPQILTDFCTYLGTDTSRWASTRGEMTVNPGPEPYETASSFSWDCDDGGDDDGDTIADDGCLTIPDPCVGVDYNGDTTIGPETALGAYPWNEDIAPATDNDGDTTIDEGCGNPHRYNPEPLTGIYETGTHLVGAYIEPQLDGNASTHANSETMTGDGVEHNLDTCPLVPNAGDPRVGGSGDGDYDGLDSACDPKPGIPSAVAVGPNGIDDDSDTLTDEDPVDNADNDGDTLIDEDGECPATSGLADEDQDCYANRHDICPLVPDNQLDTDNDGIGDACEPDWNGDTVVSNEECLSGAADCTATSADWVLDPNRKDGHTHEDNPMSAMCIPDDEGSDNTNAGAGDTDADTVIDDNDSDDDNDGWCDSTETLLGSDPADDAKTPEYFGLVYDAMPGQHMCNNVNPMNHPDGPAIDEDGDTKANMADNDTMGCICDSANDTDCDGVCDSGKTSTWCAVQGTSGDNCPNADNPDQIDSDGDGLGDACDDDDDGDTYSDFCEMHMGTDPKDDCADPKNSLDQAHPSDYTGDQVVDTTDALMFLAQFPSAVTGPGEMRYNNACADMVIDTTDALQFLADFPSSNVPVITITNNSGGAVTEVDIEFASTIVEFTSASGGGAWTLNTALPDYDLNLTTAGSLPDGQDLTINLVGRRHPVPREVVWTP